MLNLSHRLSGSLMKKLCLLLLFVLASCTSQVAAEFATPMRFLKLDTQQFQQPSMTFGIRSIPTLILFHQGREIQRLSGALPKQQFTQFNNIQVMVSEASDSSTHYTIYCEHHEFSELEYGDQLFEAVAKHILSMRKNKS